MNFPIKQNVPSDATVDSENPDIIHLEKARSRRTAETYIPSSIGALPKTLVGACAVVVSALVGTAAFIGSSSANRSEMYFSPEGFATTQNGVDVSVMSRKPLFPVFAGLDLEMILNRRNLLEESAPSDGTCLFFGETISYSPLATVDKKDVQAFFQHIDATGDGQAECKTEVEGFRWSYDINFPVNGHDKEANVYFGSGYRTGEIPYISQPVIIIDCNKSHEGVCLVGEAEDTVLPWGGISAPNARKLADDKEHSAATIEDYKAHDYRRLMKTSNTYRALNGNNDSAPVAPSGRKMTESFWKLDEVAQCWTQSYDLILYNFKGHSLLGAVPSDESSSCPTIVVDARPDESTVHIEEGEGEEMKFDKLTKFVTVLDGDLPEEKDLIIFGVSMPLRKFYAAVDFARDQSDTSSYDVLTNNCHVFIFDVLAYLKVPYKSNAMTTKMTEYASDMIMQNDRMKETLLNALSDHGVGGKLVRKLRSEKAAVKFAVRKVIESHHVDV